MNMKKIILLLVATVLLSACGPSRHAVHVEMRHPSKSGLDLSGKIVSVVYLSNDNPLSDNMLEGMSDGFAYSLEQDYATGEGSVAIYRLPQIDGAVYPTKDSLVNLLMETGSDVVFLFDTLKTGTLDIGVTTRVAVPESVDSSYLTTGSLPFEVRVYCYDSMDKRDKVHSFSGNSTASAHAYSDGRENDAAIRAKAIASLPEVGFEAGRILSGSFVSQWKHEQYSVVYFDGQKWYDALDYANQYYWKEAMDIWIGLIDTNDMLKRSCAAYNIALSCYMLGDYDLALKWLDRSDKDNKIPVSDALRKRVEARIK